VEVGVGVWVGVGVAVGVKVAVGDAVGVGDPGITRSKGLPAPEQPPTTTNTDNTKRYLQVFIACSIIR
jgi:hypothetical protein